MHLKTFGRDKWLSSRYFYENLIEWIDFSTPENKEKLKDFQRILANTIGEIIRDQYIYKEFCIVSSDKGYKIATCDEDFETGETYLYEKIDEPLKRISFIKDMHKKFLKVKPEEHDLFLAEKVV